MGWRFKMKIDVEYIEDYFEELYKFKINNELHFNHFKRMIEGVCHE